MRGEHPDRLEEESASFHERTRQAFLKLAQKNPERYLVIDATQSIEQIQAQLRDDVRKLVEQ